MDAAVQLAGLTADRLLEAARSAEEQGFSSVYVPDHFAEEPAGSGALSTETIIPEATAAIAAIGATTNRVRVGGHVLCNLFRHPALTAQATATIDQITAGRAILGLGAGWTKNEFEMTGMDFPDIKPRLRMLDESLTVIRSLWTESKTTFNGEFYRLNDAFITVKTVQKPHPPILIGGAGKGLLRLAARHADICNVVLDLGKAGTVLMSEIAGLTEDAYRAKLDFVTSEAAAAGRSLTLSSTIFMMMITSTEEEGAQMAEALAGGFGLDPAEATRMPMALVGTPEQCIAELQRREREWGIEHLVISGGAGQEAIGRFACEILPHI